MRLNNLISLNNFVSFSAQSECPKYKESDYADILNKQYSTPEEIEADHDRFVSANYDTSGFADKNGILEQKRLGKDLKLDIKALQQMKMQLTHQYANFIFSIIGFAGLALGYAKYDEVKYNQTMDNIAKNLGIVAKDVTGDGKKDLILPQNETDNVVVDFEKRELTFNETHENGKVFTSKEKFDDFFEAAGLMYGEQENGNDFFYYYNTDKDCEIDGKIK